MTKELKFFAIVSGSVWDHMMVAQGLQSSVATAYLYVEGQSSPLIQHSLQPFVEVLDLSLNAKLPVWLPAGQDIVYALPLGTIPWESINVGEATVAWDGQDLQVLSSPVSEIKRGRW